MMTTKNVSIILVGLLIPFLSIPTTRSEVSSEFQLTSDFVWRGQTQTQHGAAIQGGMSYKPLSGLSLGTWLSNTSAPHNIWQDLFAKYLHVINEDIAFDAGIIWHNFPSTSDGTLYQNFSEVELGMHWKMIHFKMDYTDNYKNTGSSSIYYFLSGQFETPLDLLLFLSWGQTSFDSQMKAGQKDYQDFHVALGKYYDNLLFQMHTTDTNRSTIHPTTGAVTKSSDKSFFVSLSRSY